MADDRLEYVRLGLRTRAASIRLRLRWDRSPRTCAALIAGLPYENQAWHAKYANNEVYTIVPALSEAPPEEWLCMYPAPGDLLYIPLSPGVVLPPGAPPQDPVKGVLDLAYFYDRGNSLLGGPAGPQPGTLFATATSVDAVEEMAVACSDVWFSGAAGERLYIEPV